MNKMWHVIIQIGKCNPIFSTYGLPDDNFVDIIELIPVFITKNNIYLSLLLSYVI